MTRKRMVLLVAIGLIAIVFAYFLNDYLTVDRCLDAGGRWDHSAGRCIGAS
jgi:hypothetical protein